MAAKVIDVNGAVLMQVAQGDFVDATEKTTLELTGGRWVEIKKELNNQETTHIQAAAYKSRVLTAGTDNADGRVEITVDFEVVQREKLLTWIIEWNLKDQR